MPLTKHVSYSDERGPLLVKYNNGLVMVACKTSQTTTNHGGSTSLYVPREELPVLLAMLTELHDTLTQDEVADSTQNKEYSEILNGPAAPTHVTRGPHYHTEQFGDHAMRMEYE